MFSGRATAVTVLELNGDFGEAGFGQQSESSDLWLSFQCQGDSCVRELGKAGLTTSFFPSS